MSDIFDYFQKAVKRAIHYFLTFASIRMRLILVHWSVEINFTFLTVNSLCIVLKNEENQVLVTFI